MEIIITQDAFSIQKQTDRTAMIAFVYSVINWALTRVSLLALSILKRFGSSIASLWWMAMNNVVVVSFSPVLVTDAQGVKSQHIPSASVTKLEGICLILLNMLKPFTIKNCLKDFCYDA